MKIILCYFLLILNTIAFANHQNLKFDSKRLNAKTTHAYSNSSYQKVKAFFAGSYNLDGCDVFDNGKMQSCLNYSQKLGTHNPKGIAFNPKGNRLYLSVYGEWGEYKDIIVCDIDVSGNISHCESAGGTGFSYPEGIAVSPDGTKLYVANNSSYRVSLCEINDDGKLGNCRYTGPTHMSSMDIAINSEGTRAYILNLVNSNISFCKIAHDGTLNDCMKTGRMFSFPKGITLSADGTHMYVPDEDYKELFLCQIKSDGTLSDCMSGLKHAPDHLLPIQVILHKDGRQAFVLSSNLNTVELFHCTVEADGKLGGCDSRQAPLLLYPKVMALGYH